MTRQPFKPRTIILVGEQQRETLLNLIPNLPIDRDKPIEVVIREHKKQRKDSQNAAMWSGPLKDLEEQGYVDGRTFSAEVWHHHCKQEFLLEEFDPDLCKEGYRKWDYSPSGERVLVGSTTQLTVKGFALYMQQIEAFGASIGVQFRVREMPR